MSERQRVMVKPINHVFRLLQNEQRIQVHLMSNTKLRIEGVLRGFDEFMNLVLDDSEELDLKKKGRRSVGRILLKGENIAFIVNAPAKKE